MSTYEWKPGDVALVLNEHGVWNVAICAVSARHGTVWSYGVADSWMPLTADARPLVVLDPDDREQVERLTGSLFEAGLVGRSVIRPGDRDAVAAALRSLVAPPRPTEPTEVGALVKDAEDNLWVRTAWSTWRCISEPDMRGQVWSGLDSPEQVQR